MNAPSTPRPLSVHELTLQIKDSLEASFPAVWVAGELSDVARPQSGHIYLTLKDEHAQIRGVIWRAVASRLKFEPRDGQAVICLGGLDVYPPRGAYQLVIRRLEPQGLGALQLALRQLQQRLAAEGLFDARHKQPLPAFPRRIAFVTSPTGAAVRDFLEVLRRRWRGADVLIIPAKVQGAGAAEDIVRGIRAANAMPDRPDVLVVGRGGGSLEDLWCFNEESVVRAIFASHIPVVSAVGHEIDVTLSDLAADVRALTPSEAAELVVPSADELRAQLHGQRRQLLTMLRRRSGMARQRVDGLAQRRMFRRPFDLIHDLARRVDELQMQAGRAIARRQQRSRDQLGALANRLESLSPLAVLARGYSMTQRAADGRVVRDSTEVHDGDMLLTRLARGTLHSRVEHLDP
jgi:exodeoxyribonuclease VII large subunit